MTHVSENTRWLHELKRLQSTVGTCAILSGLIDDARKMQIGSTWSWIEDQQRRFFVLRALSINS